MRALIKRNHWSNLVKNSYKMYSILPTTCEKISKYIITKLMQCITQVHYRGRGAIQIWKEQILFRRCLVAMCNKGL